MAVKLPSSLKSLRVTIAQVSVATWLAAPVLGFLLGCSGQPPPATYPVSGQVLQADRSPLTGGEVVFNPLGRSDASTTGVIQPDGSFELITVVNGQRVPGALAGEHRVTVVGEMDERQVPAMTTLPQTYTVKPSEDRQQNSFELVLPQ